MYRKLVRHTTPRWILFLIETGFVALAFWAAIYLKHRLNLPIGELLPYLPFFFINMGIGVAGMYFFHTYGGMIRFSGMRDIQRVVGFSLFQFLCWCLLLLVFRGQPFSGRITLDLLVINASIVTSLFVCFRIFIREVYLFARTQPQEKKQLLIYGAGEAGMATIKAFEIHKMSGIQVVGFVDDDPRKIGKYLDGKKIFSPAEVFRRMERLRHPLKVDELVLAFNHISAEKRNEVFASCSRLGIKVTVIPPLHEWINGVFRLNQLRELTIESLLERDEIQLDQGDTVDTYEASVVLVTGAAGSIGSEICRQLLRYKLYRLVLVDQSESGLHDLVLELKQQHAAVELFAEVATVRDAARIQHILERYRPHHLFHAAAYKHVPIMEAFPSESVLTNVMGTRIVADAALRCGVNRFIMVSTDKAVNPTNIMGACKRMAEMYIQSLADSSDGTQFITTRFGNVLGSNGSVVPLFKKQIQQGGPVTVTHPEVTRYFMTIPEACRLVLEACVMGEGGDIFVFDMGKPVRITDLAFKMIRLAGYTPDKEIKVEYTGLRPGEKMYEELFKESEDLQPTHHPLILRARKTALDADLLEADINELVEAALEHKHPIVRKKIKNILPEYVEMEVG